MSNESKWEKLNQKLNLGEINDERKDVMRKLIEKYEEICEYDGERSGTVNKVKHKIEIKEEKYYRFGLLYKMS